MRRPRDLDAELEALARRAKALKGRRTVQFGELVIATGADALDPECLAGALLAATRARPAEQEGWRREGAAFFRRETPAASGAAAARGGASPDAGGDPPG